MSIDKEIFGMLLSVSNRLQTVGDLTLQDLTIKQWFVIKCIKRFYPEKPTLSQTALLVGSSRQNVKQIVIKLEEKGFIRILQDEKDRRILRLVLNDEKNEYWESIKNEQELYLKEFFKTISIEEKEKTHELLLKLDKNLREIYREKCNDNN